MRFELRFRWKSSSISPQTPLMRLLIIHHMGQKNKASQPSSKTLPKAATGIQGLDEITGGGLPHGRPTLISGGAGAGKTLFGLEFLVRGATQYSEPGVFISFEESIFRSL